MLPNYKLQLTHRYSELDKEHQFGIASIGHHLPAYTQWVWFHLGRLTKGKYSLYPYTLEGKQLGEYRLSSADRTAKLIINKIKRAVKK